jgi:hypothetical protein
MRRRLPWVVALPVMAAGSLAAHSLSYLFVPSRSIETGSEASERASAGGAGNVVLFLGIVAAMAAVGAGLALVRRRRCGAAASPWLFFVLPPLAFTSQELAERLLHAEAFPFQAALEPRFLLGLLLQLPFGLVALLVARWLLRVVERLVLVLVGTKTLRVAARVSWSPRQASDLPRIPALALGYPERGPPTP